MFDIGFGEHAHELFTHTIISRFNGSERRTNASLRTHERARTLVTHSRIQVWPLEARLLHVSHRGQRTDNMFAEPLDQAVSHSQ